MQQRVNFAAMWDDLDLNAIQDENARQLIERLLNLIEQLSADLREAQAEIQRLREQDRVYYEKLSRMKDEVLGTASHDLKNPLSVIMTSLHLIKRHGRIDDERGKQFDPELIDVFFDLLDVILAIRDKFV